MRLLKVKGVSNSKRKKKLQTENRGCQTAKIKLRKHTSSSSPSSSSRQLRLLHVNFSLQAAVRDRCVAAGARRRRSCRCVAAGGRRGCVRVRLLVSRLHARVGCGRDAAGAREARGWVLS